MAGSYAANVRTARMNAVKTLAEAGSGAARILLRTSGNVVLASFACDDPAGVSGDVLTLIGTPSAATAGNTGSAANAVLTDSDGNVIRSGMSVGLSAADVILSSLSITSGQSVTLNSATITHG